MTAMPVHAPTPPWKYLRPLVINTAINVGRVPKNSPPTLSITDHVSKKTPGMNSHGVNITATPSIPKTIPVRILMVVFSNAGCRTIVSNTKANATNNAALFNNPINVDVFMPIQV